MEPPQIQGYQIETEIGSGAAGVVYLATREDGSRCAIKVFEAILGATKLLLRFVTLVGPSPDIGLLTIAVRLKSPQSLPVAL